MNTQDTLERYLDTHTPEAIFQVMRVVVNCRKGQKQLKNIGAKVTTARFAKVLNLLTATLTRCLCKAREHVAKSEEIRQKTTMR